MNARLGFVASSMAAIGIVVLSVLPSDSPPASEAESYTDALMREIPPAVVGDASKVERAYAEYREEFLFGARAGKIAIPFGWSKGLCDGPKGTFGSIEFDFFEGTVRAQITRQQEDVDLWLVENVTGPGKSVAPEVGDHYSLLGTVAADQEGGLVLRLDELSVRDFRPDLVLATPAGTNPADVNALAVGHPSLFDRLVMKEQAREAAVSARTGLPLAIMVPQNLVPSVTIAPEPMLQGLVSFGEQIFFNETFNGNSRTCGTCHPAENNLTIDATFIETLPPTDPLFVAEHIPALNYDLNGGLRFENPDLMRKLGLIVENLDGFGNLSERFVMRSVSHVFAQSSTILPPAEEHTPPIHRTGWGGDGSPGTGTLREFAIGAVRQHFPRTMNRQAGLDFRLPTDQELDALEAFQRALGRQSDYDLGELVFSDKGAEDGKALFEAECSLCHQDAGANSSGSQPVPMFAVDPPGNGRFDTGIELAIQQPGAPVILIAERPFDGGFGVTPEGAPLEFAEPVADSQGGFGDGSFNIPSLVEFADTTPAFHNHATSELDFGMPDDDPVERAIRFYDTDEFRDSPGGDFFKPEISGPEVVEDIARFLRGINALQNSFEARRFTARAISLLQLDTDATTRAITLALADCEDGVQVLKAAVELNEDAQALFESAITRLDLALNELLTGPPNLMQVQHWLIQGLNDINAAGQSILD